MTMIDRDELLKHEVMIITKGNAAFHGVPSSLIETAPVIDLKNLQPVWRDPETDPPKVETEVLVLYRYNGYMGITTAHYEDGNVFSEDSKILPGELRALVMVSNCLEREFVHRQLATGQPLHMNVL